MTKPLTEQLERLQSEVAWESSPRRRSILQARFAAFYFVFSLQGAAMSLAMAVYFMACSATDPR
jgi:hypothetical protein